MPSLSTSSIPSTAIERITERYPSGKKERAEFWLDRKHVGTRLYFESGNPEHEYSLKSGKKHGIEYWWFPNGKLDSAEPFVDGVPHGVAKQWDHEGRRLGTYKMTRGTGIDLWRQRSKDGSVWLSEIMYCKNGRRHGFEWRVNEDQKTVYIERHWHNGHLHGIEREWNRNGRLCRGYPKFFVAGVQVTKRQYQRLCVDDPTLPSFNPNYNDPTRRFPTEIATHLKF
jgi:antitoxin component YwqK of YwqJK toxin-antitoxin module